MNADSTHKLSDSRLLDLVAEIVGTAEAARPAESADSEAFRAWRLTMAGAAMEVVGALRAAGRL